MTAARCLSIYYRYAPRYERWRSGKPLSHEERIELQKEEDAADALGS